MSTDPAHDDSPGSEPEGLIPARPVEGLRKRTNAPRPISPISDIGGDDDSEVMQVKRPASGGKAEPVRPSPLIKWIVLGVVLLVGVGGAGFGLSKYLSNSSDLKKTGKIQDNSSQVQDQIKPPGRDPVAPPRVDSVVPGKPVVDTTQPPSDVNMPASEKSGGELLVLVDKIRSDQSFEEVKEVVEEFERRMLQGVFTKDERDRAVRLAGKLGAQADDREVRNLMRDIEKLNDFSIPAVKFPAPATTPTSDVDEKSSEQGALMLPSVESPDSESSSSVAWSISPLGFVLAASLIGIQPATDDQISNSDPPARMIEAETDSPQVKGSKSEDRRRWRKWMKGFGPTEPVVSRLNTGYQLAALCRAYEESPRGLREFCDPMLILAEMTLSESKDPAVCEQCMDRSRDLTQLKNFLLQDQEISLLKDAVRKAKNDAKEAKETAENATKTGLAALVDAPEELKRFLEQIGIPAVLGHLKVDEPGPAASAEQKATHARWLELKTDLDFLTENSKAEGKFPVNQVTEINKRIQALRDGIIYLELVALRARPAGSSPVPQFDNSAILTLLKSIDSRLEAVPAAKKASEARQALLLAARRQIELIRTLLKDEKKKLTSVELAEIELQRAQILDHLMRLEAPDPTPSGAAVVIDKNIIRDFLDRLKLPERLAQLQPAAEKTGRGKPDDQSWLREVWEKTDADYRWVQNELDRDGDVFKPELSGEVDSKIRGLLFGVLQLEIRKQVGGTGKPERAADYCVIPTWVVSMQQLCEGLAAIDRQIAAIRQRHSEDLRELDARIAKSVDQMRQNSLASNNRLSNLQADLRNEIDTALAKPRSLPSDQLSAVSTDAVDRVLNVMASYGFSAPAMPRSPIAGAQQKDDRSSVPPNPLKIIPVAKPNPELARQSYAKGISTYFSSTDGSLAAAVRHFSEAAQRDPKLPIYRYFLAVSLYRQGHFVDAVEQANIGKGLADRFGEQGANQQLERVQGATRTWLETIRREH